MLRLIHVVGLLFFVTSMVSAQSESCACCSSEYRQFDFWIGNWTVYRPDSSLAGTNIIRLVQDSCILQENWKSATSAYSGTSYNFYDRRQSNWHQLWIDNQGGHLLLKGRRTGNAMIMYSDTLYNADGSAYLDRVTWTRNDDGTVRQLWERSAEKDVWEVVFDGLYKRKQGE